MSRSFRLLAIVALVAAARPGLAQFKGQTPEIIRINDRVYCAAGYAMGNVIFVVTDTSVVVVDTTESPLSGEAVLKAFRKVSDLPVSHIIYTHFHGDHVNGARAFQEDETQIIAQRQHETEGMHYAMLRLYNRRVNAAQFASTLREKDREVAIALDPRFPILGYIEPDVLFDEEYSFEQGGVRFELRHAPGETRDHLFVWLPQTRTLLPGDLFYWSFPMLSSPMKPDRPVLAWAESIERMQALEPEYLVSSHLAPVSGSDTIRTVLGDYARAIRHVHDETVRLIEEGLPLEEIRRQVQLPAELVDREYLAPLYGRVPWAVNGVYRQYTGWYDFNPTHLNPGPRARFQGAVLEASGGASPLVARAEKALADGDPQLALELVDLVLGAEPENRSARAARITALERLAAASSNAVERNIYRAAAAERDGDAQE
jgi:alkyl sulfatase BDS1-like metallo-beta-lactamase superfamily hydrolase